MSIKTGLWMLAGFIVFFLLMYMLGLGHRSELRLFNGVIHMTCIYAAIRSYYSIYPDKIENYVSGVVQGMIASLVGVGGFAAFMTIFLTLNPSLMESIRQNSDSGHYLTPFTSCIFIVTEGIVAGLIGSYIMTRVMQWNIEHGSGHS